METRPAYERNPYQKQRAVRVVAVGEHGGHPMAVLDDTLIFPEGGGQPSDHGRLGSVEVVDAVRHPEGVRHLLAAPVEVGLETTREVDWRRRFDPMQQHTAQHLLTAVAADRFGWPTTSFHLGDDVCDIEIDAPDLDRRQLDALEEAVAAEIRAAHEVRDRRVPKDEFERLDVRTRGLPAGHTGSVRLVEIEGLDLNACGGTHLRSTAEIETVVLLATEPKRGGQRLLWVAGGRARRRLGEHETRNADLRRVLGAADDELVEIAAGKLDQLKEALRRLRAAEGRWLEAEADRLASRAAASRTAEAHFDDVDGGFLKRFAARFQEQAPASAALLTAATSGVDGGLFLLVAGPDSGIDAAELGPRVATVLGGRGGGRGTVFQGKAGSFAERDMAVELLRGAAGA